MKQRKMKPKRRGERVLRRASTLRRSQRSVGRSGYAFSHEEGFGELITSGSLMIRKRPIRFGKRTGINKVVAPATVENVTVSPPPKYTDCLDDSGVPSVSEEPAVIGNEPSNSEASLSPIEETSFRDADSEPRIPVYV